jgi:CubicO group peptidase (beta-lactamase class C family)
LKTTVLRFVSACLALLGPGPVATQRPATAAGDWPTIAWTEASPESQGMDSRELARLFDFVRQRHVPIHSLLIVRNGRMVLDASFFPYRATELHDLASGTKSVTATLIGVAIGRHELADVNQPVWPIFSRDANHDARKQRMTIEDLLTMRSGIACDWMNGEQTLDDMRHSRDWVRFVLDRAMTADPGTTFAYCSPGMHLLSGVLSKVTGGSALEYARRELFGPLGIDRSEWPADASGISYGWGDLHLRPRDMAKLGLLWLSGGVWNGRRIVPADWMASAARAQVTHMGEGYGYGLWVYPERQPPVFEANGRGGQRISVVPALQLVAVMTGGGFEPGDIGDFIGKAIKADDAIPENPAARSALAAAIADAARSPVPRQARALPKFGSAISGRRWTLDRNPLGLDAMTLSFSRAAQAIVRLEFADGRAEERPVGLDGVPRVSPDGRWGLPVAVSGEWNGDSTFTLEYDEVSNINCFQFQMTFADRQMSVRVRERTGLLEARFRGRRP